MTRLGTACLIMIALMFSVMIGGSPLSKSAAAQTPTLQSENAPISLVANRVEFDPAAKVLVASGNVQVFRGTQVLQTEWVVYDQGKGRLSVPGPLTIVSGDDLTTRAQSAELDADLRNGLIQGAELLIQQQLQLVARRFERKDGKYKVLHKTVATACYVCAKNPTPFWKIRAERVIHDEEARRLYFENATLDVLGFPIFYAPRLRIPDPSVERATGFLVPRFSTSNILGYGMEIPYYWTLGDHADLTLTTQVYSKGSFLLAPEYRRKYRNGDIQLGGHFTLADTLAPRNQRSSVSARGLFDLPNEIEFEFGIEAASDKSFRDDYDIGLEGEDRLTSFVTLRRTRKNSYASVSTSYIQSLRANEIDQEIPLVLPEFYGRKTWKDPLLGGKFGLTAQSVTLLREDDSEFSRIGLAADWRRDWILRNGLIVGAYTGVQGNSYRLENYPGFGDRNITEVVPTAALDFRLPLARQNGRVTHTLVPRVQIVWSPDDAQRNPNEDSVQLEYEETNLFSTNRFPGFDASERGLRANVGLSYNRYDPNGWGFGVTVGRVFRAKDLNQFGAGTGLEGRHSDYVSALTFSYQDKIDFINRTLFDDDFKVSKNEALLKLNYDKYSATASYVFLEQDVVAGASDESHEAALAVTYRHNDFWTYSGEWRQNLETGSATNGKFGVRYENECVAVNLSLSLQYEGSGIVRPTRALGLTVELAGLGNKKRNSKYANRCAAL